MWDHSVYNLEAEMRRTSRQKKTVHVSPLDKLTAREQLLVESAYRRGFHQGWHACLKNSLDGIPTRSLEKFLYGALFRWRHSKHGGKLKPPPVPHQVKSRSSI